MLGHNHVPDDHKPVTAAHLFEHLQKQVTPLPSSEQRPPMVTTEGDEVKIASAVVSM
jgi:hypothetical protein